MVGLSDGERALLTPLGVCARKVAPLLSAAFAKRASACSMFSNFSGEDSDSFKARMQAWFVDLFEAHPEGVRSEDQWVNERFFRYPVSPVCIIVMMDVILNLGRRVTRYSHKRERAVRAFYMSLALQLTLLEQCYELVRRRLSTQLMLLD